MIAHALYDGGRAGISYTESFSRHAVDEELSGSSAVKSHVSDDDVVFRLKCDVLRRIDDDRAAGKSLSDIVVAVAAELQRQPFWNESAEALTAGSRTLDVIRILRQRISI